ncbi:ABC transporter permease [Lactobacillus kitasatonis]|uniref:ABC transporter permease n=1 Tax=Lactobacillus kitasatonis TaxID=237446 RepID=UPI0026EA22AC|nr:ABC transporter permease [Lactobacillus kitasatonis]
MTSNKALFKQMFLQKRRYADLVLLVQVFAVAFMFLMGIIFRGNSNPINNISSVFAGNDNIWDLILGLGVLTTFFVDITFLGLMCWQNEKINLSQTWQLIPASSSKIWIFNIISSIVECAYIFVIQVVIGLIVLIIDSYSHHINPFSGTSFGANISFVESAWALIEELLALVGLCLIIFAFVSLINFLTRTITDQLPVKNTTGIRLVVMAILVIVGVIIAMQINDQMMTIYYNHLAAHSETIDMDNIGLAALEYWIGSILLGIINCLLIQKFVEPKIINR